MTAKMPVLFIGHGTPMNALENNKFSQSWVQLNHATPKPKAILCISAHWLTDETRVSCIPNPSTIHDFSGFPKALFDVQYPCPGTPELAQEICARITSTNIQMDHSMGLDHGCWSVLKHLYPMANIPAAQLSIAIHQPPEYHYQLGQQLQFLREQEVLIIASGNIVHNIQKWLTNPSGPIDWAKHFNQHAINAVINHDHQALLNYRQWQPEADQAVPTPEHYLPLLYCLGLQQIDDQLQLADFEPVNLENCSMTSLSFH